MFESPTKEMDDTSPLLPNFRENNNEKKNNSMISSRSFVIVLVCLTSLILLSVFSFSSNNKSILSYSFDIVQVKSLDNEHGPNGEIYCDEEGKGECLERTLGFCWKHGPCVNKPTQAPTSVPTPKPSNVDNCNPHNPPCAKWFIGICVEYEKCLISEPPTSVPSRSPTTSSPTTLKDCDPKHPPCKLKDFFGICYEHYTCLPDNPTSTPTGTPTPKPSTTKDCDPLKPPCEHDFLSVCYKYVDCGKEGNHDSYPYKPLFPEITPYPSHAPTPSGPCDPTKCVHGDSFIGICWKYQDCSNQTLADGGAEAGSGSGDGGAEAGSGSNGGAEAGSGSGSNGGADGGAGSGSNGGADGGAEAGSGSGSNGGADGGSGSGSNGGADGGSGSGSNGGAEAGSGSGSDGGAGGKHHKPSQQFTFAPFDMNFKLDLHLPPTHEPTTKHNCDPEAPPCKKYNEGICVEYMKCYGIHSTPKNMTWDDDSYTIEPSHTPLTPPSPQPSNPPTSTPSTSAPTVRGYTPMPTISMMPTPADTHGPTQFNLCDPDLPPCDNYFFGVCLGKRYCYGSHRPSPHPTIAPFVSHAPIQEPTEQPVLIEIFNPSKKSSSKKAKAASVVTSKKAASIVTPKTEKNSKKNKKL